jgi:sec-independent protein translocase protein TatA
MHFGTTELLIILVIVVLLFGTKRLRSLGSDIGSTIRSFRRAVTEDEEAPHHGGSKDTPAEKGQEVASDVSARDNT